MNRNLLIVTTGTTTVSALAVTPHVQTSTTLEASLDYCTYQSGGQKRTAPAFQQCMATRSYQLASPSHATEDAINQIDVDPAANAAAQAKVNANIDERSTA